MKKPEMQYQPGLSVSLHVLMVHRWVNRMRRAGSPHGKSGDRRYRMAYRANARRQSQDRLFRFNPYRHRRTCFSRAKS